MTISLELVRLPNNLLLHKQCDFVSVVNRYKCVINSSKIKQKTNEALNYINIIFEAAKATSIKLQQQNLDEKDKLYKFQVKLLNLKIGDNNSLNSL